MSTLNTTRGRPKGKRSSSATADSQNSGPSMDTSIPRRPNPFNAEQPDSSSTIGSTSSSSSGDSVFDSAPNERLKPIEDDFSYLIDHEDVTDDKAKSSAESPLAAKSKQSGRNTQRKGIDMNNLTIEDDDVPRNEHLYPVLRARKLRSSASLFTRETQDASAPETESSRLSLPLPETSKQRSKSASTSDTREGPKPKAPKAYVHVEDEEVVLDQEKSTREGRRPVGRPRKTAGSSIIEQPKPKPTPLKNQREADYELSESDFSESGSEDNNFEESEDEESDKPEDEESDNGSSEILTETLEVEIQKNEDSVRQDAAIAPWQEAFWVVVCYVTTIMLKIIPKEAASTSVTDPDESDEDDPHSTPKFVPYCHGNTKEENKSKDPPTLEQINSKMIDFLQKGINVKETDGSRKKDLFQCIYVFRCRDNTRHVKIGKTGDIGETRRHNIKTTCKVQFDRNEDPNAPVKLEFGEIIEKVVHAELWLKRRQFECDKCKKGKIVNHNEYFRISPQEAIQSVDQWRTWLGTHKPYGHNGKLTEFWERRLTKRSSTRVDYIDWDRFRNPTKYDFYYDIQELYGPPIWEFLKGHFKRKDLRFLLVGFLILVFIGWTLGKQQVLWGVVALIIL